LRHCTSCKIEDFEKAYREKRFNILSLYEKLKDKTITDEKGQGLYHAAAKYADAEAVEALLKAGADPNEPDEKTHWSALEAAVQMRYN
jgi:ankyrin repeat protein